MDLVIQTYEVRSVTHDGKLVYASDFTLYRAGSVVPAAFCAYSKLYKQRLWEVIFAIKRKFFEDVRLDVVEHFIKSPYRVEARLALYKAYLNLPEYVIEQTSTTFTFLRRE
ncbi:MAG: hypothetical protein ACRYG7_10395 [Janthinobacterium lividum]